MITDARQILSEVRTRWQAGDQPNAAEILNSNPELKQHHSVILDLVYEEYCLREEAGETINLASFSRRFPTIQKSLSRLLVVHQMIQNEPAHRRVRWPAIGDMVFDGEFKVMERLGQGAFAQVFLCRDELHRRDVVIKIAADTTAEAYTLGRLQHVGIVPVFDVRCDSEMTGIIMPYLGRNTMCHLLDEMWSSDEPRASGVVQALADHEKVDLPSNNVSEGIPAELNRVDGMLWMVAKLAESLAYAHAKDILHGDIKPSNILLTANGYPMLLDFNLAQDTQRQSARVGGTIPYMAPEQLHELFVLPPTNTPKESAYDVYSEVFSVGVILYELLTGRLPFGDYEETVGKDLATKCIAAQRCGPPPIQRPDVDADAAQVVCRCLQFDRHDRFSNMLELQDALEASFGAKESRLTRRSILMGSMLAITFGSSLVAARQRSTFSVACDAYQRRDYQSAIERLTVVLDEEPNHPLANYLRGRSYLQRDQFEPAANDFSESFQRTQTPSDLSMAGYCWQRVGDLTAAEKSYKKSLLLDDESYATWNNLGCVRAQTEQRDLAINAFDRALLCQENGIALFNRVLAGNESRGESPPSESLVLLAMALANSIHSDTTGDPQRDLPHSLTPRESLLIGEVYLAAFESHPELLPLGIELLVRAREFRQSTGNSAPPLPPAVADKYAEELGLIRRGRKARKHSYTYIVPSPEKSFDIERWLAGA